MLQKIMKIKITLAFIILLFCFACKNRNSSSNSPAILNNKSDAGYLKVQNIPLLDTIIILSDTKNADISNKAMSEQEAEMILYKYFKQKGVGNRNEFKGSLLNSQGRRYVEYDTIYPIHTDKFSGNIILYWIGSADLNGQCFQPSKAIILNARGGSKMTNEAFIPANFSIDSVVESTIYGYDYDCGGKGILRYLKVTLQ